MFTGKLHPYQVDAVDMMLERKSLLVAYDMGLGKTILSIAAVEALIESGKVTSALVVVPAGLKYQWARQIAKWTDVDKHTEGKFAGLPKLPSVALVDGTPKQRQEMYEYINQFVVDYTIVSYNQVVDDWKYIKKLPKDCLIIDEATYIKSFRAQRSKHVKRLQSDYRYALSGQPLETKPQEVFSIMQWVDDNVLGRWDLFDRSFIVRDGFGRMMRMKNVPILHNKLKTAMVRKRRTDPDVAPYMPKVDEAVYFSKFDTKSAKLYRMIAAEILADLKSLKRSGKKLDIGALYNGTDSHDMQEVGKIMAKLTALSQLCDHPQLIVDSARNYENPDIKEGSQYAYSLYKAGYLDGLDKSQKLKDVAAFIREKLDSGEAKKFVIFSQYKSLQKYIAAEMPELGVTFFNGDMNAKEKDYSKQQFEQNPAIKLFVSSDAGGYGVDLPNANYLINLDLPWSSGKWDQRNARIIRASSEFDWVYVINWLMQGSTEERMYDLLVLLRLVASAVIDGEGADKRGRVVWDLATLSEFLESSNV